MINNIFQMFKYVLQNVKILNLVHIQIIIYVDQIVLYILIYILININALINVLKNIFM